MRKIELLVAIVFFSIFFGYVFYSAIQGKERGTRFYHSEFRKKVKFVDYHDKLNRIGFIDGSDLSITLNYKPQSMRKYYGHLFSEFIFPEDSVIKMQNQNWFLIKRSDTVQFKLYY